uniref:NADH dehydrogenase-like complex N n=1 Tax=Kalanchoe fedtschenkoi TaxID=63787 RepID=A0A7N0R962_KALFE
MSSSAFPAATACSIPRSQKRHNALLLHPTSAVTGLTVSSQVSRSLNKSWSRNMKTKRRMEVRCRGIGDFIGGDLLKFDLGQWLSDVEEHKSIAIYPPHEGGYEGRYLNRLRYQGYHFLDLSARGLGDPETTLTKIHPVCPAHVGKQPIARWYYPPEVDYRLSLLPPGSKGLVVWILEAKVLSKAELQFLALLPTLRPNVRVIAECGNWRKFVWKPLKEISGLTAEDGSGT